MFNSVRSALAIPAAYEMWWNFVGGPRWAQVLVDEFIQPREGVRVLEIGCGPGTIVSYLPHPDYLGFDLSPNYIAKAKKKFPGVRFVCERVNQFSLAEAGSFDLVLALGIVHHLDDDEASQLFQISHDALKVGGKLVTVDGVFTDNQSTMAKHLLRRDRGRYVRREQQYKEIAFQAFQNVRATVRNDLLRIPYSHLILQCART